MVFGQISSIIAFIQMFALVTSRNPRREFISICKGSEQYIIECPLGPRASNLHTKCQQHNGDIAKVSILNENSLEHLKNDSGNGTWWALIPNPKSGITPYCALKCKQQNGSMVFEAKTAKYKFRAENCEAFDRPDSNDNVVEVPRGTNHTIECIDALEGIDIQVVWMLSEPGKQFKNDPKKQGVVLPNDNYPHLSVSPNSRALNIIKATDKHFRLYTCKAYLAKPLLKIIQKSFLVKPFEPPEPPMSISVDFQSDLAGSWLIAEVSWQPANSSVVAQEIDHYEVVYYDKERVSTVTTIDVFAKIPVKGKAGAVILRAKNKGGFSKPVQFITYQL